MGCCFPFAPEYSSSALRTALRKYDSGSSSPPLPPTRSVSHHAPFVPSLCFVFSHARRAPFVRGPIFLNQRHPLFQRVARLFLQFPNPLLHYDHAGMHIINGPPLHRSFDRHVFTSTPTFNFPV